jgi:hypothetical protein
MSGVVFTEYEAQYIMHPLGERCTYCKDPLTEPEGCQKYAAVAHDGQCKAHLYCVTSWLRENGTCRNCKQDVHPSNYRKFSINPPSDYGQVVKAAACILQ